MTHPSTFEGFEGFTNKARGPGPRLGAYRRSVTDAANPRAVEGFSTTEGATIFCSSSAMAMAIMETPEPTATPMPMRPPREMMESAV